MRIRSRFLRDIIGAFEFSQTRSSLPPRILSTLDSHDHTSEVLIKFIQILVFGIFLILYFTSPLPTQNLDSQVPLVLGIYIGVSVAIIILARFWSLPSPLIYALIFIDIALLTFLIWSYHIQYGQSAPFSLKSPTMLLYFVLIGVRALRFSARYVLAAGLSTAICWSALVYYSIHSTTSYDPVTSIYVTYLTGNYVLIGAEIVKVVTIIIFTFILALVVRRAYSFLVTSILEGQAAHDLSRFMPTDVATQIRTSERDIMAGDGKRLDVAILSVDIRGFTKLVEHLEPADAMGILSDYQHQIVPIVHKHGGIIDKYMGDGIMITFGAPTPDKNYCANALSSAIDILSSRSSWTGKASNVQVNLAVTSGAVIYGAVGDGDRLEYTVIGAAVNRCAKLEKLNKHFSSLGICDLATYNLAVEQGFIESGEPNIVNSRVEGTDSSLDLVLLGESDV